jgi:uncharacterized protein (DUF433 family)
MLGQGIYILSEVSRLTQMHPSRVSSWFKARADGVGRGPIFASDYESVKGDFAVSFFDLIDVLVASQFRDKHNVPMGIVRKAHSILQKRLNVQHPFCHSDLYTDGKHIFHYVADEVNNDKLSDVISQQQFFTHIKAQLEHIDYSEVTKLACRWNIAEGIIIDPTISMGKPIIQATGVTTFVLANQYCANEKNVSLVADLYGVGESDVINAVRFEESIGCKHAA